MTDETRAKLRAAWTPERRNAQRLRTMAANAVRDWPIGIRFTPEHMANIKAAQQRRRKREQATRAGFICPLP